MQFYCFIHPSEKLHQDESVLILTFAPRCYLPSRPWERRGGQSRQVRVCCDGSQQHCEEATRAHHISSRRWQQQHVAQLRRGGRYHLAHP